MRLNIRWRLALWNVLGLAVVLAGFAVLVYALLAHTHYEHLDRSVLAEFRELEEEQRADEEGRARLRDWIAEVKEHDNFTCVLYDAEGKVYERTRELSDDMAPPAPHADDRRRFFDADFPGLGRQRVLVGELRAGARPFTAVLMAPLEEVDRELGLLLWAILLAVPAALAASGGWSYFMARKALAPMERLRRSTEEITATRLDRRLPIANSHDELGRLTLTINEMISRLERSFVEVRRFTADASHELRSPLAVIRSEAEVALNRPIGEEVCRNLLGSILEEVERLTRLTDQLLVLAREDADAAPRPQGPVDLTALVGVVVENMRPLAESKGIAFTAEADGPVEVRGDEVGLREIVYNLLENAIKYTAGGGEVAVRCGRGGGEAFVVVRDTGVGIAPEHQARVFDRFYRVDRTRSREQGGTGLGLSIARSLAAAHGGSIELESAPGKGATFIVRLPEGGEAPNGEGGTS
jgi:two-component system, OmpR family, heavy metal sensor histidine kinase CusS